ncbi:polycystin-2-like protein 2 isoform X4 [Lagenorhynchus albirostris]|uniref:polycystin-2-like protein 2 isoform X4 n=1 Tax=Lagenorhynchus albirostris TaxID=27610 RepID=UPI0028E6B603|nr:polycystin-2-like protein 2 isoform X4 [Lagenorhynchus albirostris]
MRTTLQEVLLYLIFLINLCILTFGMVNPHMYYLNKVMSSLFLDTSVHGEERINFKSIRSITDFWKFMEGPLLEGLYWDSWYNNKSLYDLKNSSRIYYENILLGVPRVRQLKVRNNTCKVHSSFQSLMNECYDKYTSENEDLSDFGLKYDTEWKYSAPIINSPWHWGFTGVYRNGGYIFTLSKSKSETLNKFINLRMNSWITRSTRVIFIDFSLYNANVNLFCVIRFTQFRIVLGDFNFAGIQQASRILGPIYFITFIFFVFFVLLNMFLAIINDTYSEVKADYSIGRRPDFELGKMIKKSYHNALEKLKLKKPETDEDKKSRKSRDLAEQARREGFDEKEIQSAEQMKKWKERLEKKYYSTEIQDDYQPVTQQEFRDLFLYAVELEKELHYVSLKLNRVMRKVSALQY